MASTTDLDDVFISVKTTRQNHYGRLLVILETWVQLARNQTWFITDTVDPYLQLKTNGHMINTSCPSSHSIEGLCCKMSVEFDTYLKTKKKWFCHFDDDNYVNVPNLVKFLGHYDPRKDWYFGKRSRDFPMEIKRNGTNTIKFWFATGGAGFCISQALALRMIPVAANGKFVRFTKEIKVSDDATMGYIVVTTVFFPKKIKKYRRLQNDKIADQEKMDKLRDKPQNASIKYGLCVSSIDFVHMVKKRMQTYERKK